MSRRWFPHAVVCTAATMALYLPGPLLPPAQAASVSLSPSDPIGREHWINPQLRVIDAESTAKLSLESVTAQISMGGQVSLSVEATAPGKLAGEDFHLRVSRTGQVASVADARLALAQDPSAFTVSSARVPLEGGLSATEASTMDHTVPTTGPGGLAITEPGAYPVQVELVHSATNAIVNTERFLLGVGLDERREQTQDIDGDVSAPSVETPLSVIIPVTAPIDRLGGETGEAPERAPLVLKSEQLASLLAPTGRLSALINAYSEAAYSSATLAQASCLAIDPELIDTVQRMATDGYLVSDTRPSAVSQKLRLRDSWDVEEETRHEQPGIGQQDAQLWLDKVSSIASDACVVATPWAQADVGAVAATGNPHLLAQATAGGSAVLAETLGAQPLEGVIIPPNGYLTETAAQALGATGRQHTALVASNSVWSAPTYERFAHLSDRVGAVTFDASVAATIAESMEDPATVGYGNYLTRYDQTLDAHAARTATATTAVQWTVATSTDPLLITLPETLGSTAAELEQWLTLTTDLFDSPLARPMAVAEYLAASTDQQAGLQDQVTATGGVERSTSAYGSPFIDPTGFSDAEIHQASTLANGVQAFSSLMIPDPAIALTPDGFVAPLLQDVVRSLSHYGRRSMGTFDDAVAATYSLLNQDAMVLAELRGSVSLLSPGHVYTRTSDSSPLLIAARNGLPLPAEARIMFSGPEGANVYVPEHVIIPAKGSITVSLTADLPGVDTSAHPLSLWLATLEGEPISQPVSMSVNTRNLGVGQAWGLAIGLIAILAVGARWALKGRKKAATSPMARRAAQRRQDRRS